MSLDFDNDVFDNLSASLDTVFPEILEVFFDETETSLKELNEHIHHEELTKIHDVAHKLKSSTKTFGASGLVNILVELETLEEDKFDKAKSLQQTLNEEYILVKEHINSK